MKRIAKFFLTAASALSISAVVFAQDAAAPFQRVSPSPTPALAIPSPAETRPSKPQPSPSVPPAQTPSPAPKAKPTPAPPAPSPTPSPQVTPKPASPEKSPRRILREKPVRAVEPPVKTRAPKTQPSTTGRPAQTPSPTPKATPTPAPPAPSPTPSPQATPKPAGREKPPRPRLREKPVRAVEPRKPWIRRIPAEKYDGPRAYQPTFDLSGGNWAAKTRLRALENKWQAAIKNHDVETLEKLLDDDFVATSSAGKTASKARLLRELRNDKSVYRSTRARGMSVRTVRPGVAVVTGIATETGTKENGQKFAASRRFTDTWKQRDGDWKCVASEVKQLPKR